MTTSRRNFIQNMGLLAGAFSANSIFNEVHAADLEAANKKIINLSPEQASGDEDYWSVITNFLTKLHHIICGVY